MDTFWRTVLWQQFGGAIDTLNNALQSCPDNLWTESLWEDASGHQELSQFWYLVYHALFWLDAYLDGTEEGFLPPPPFILIEQDESGPIPQSPYSKAELTTYLQYGRTKCQRIIETMTDEDAQRLCHFGWGEVSFAELLLYNLRHLQEHATQCNLFIGQRASFPPGFEPFVIRVGDSVAE